MHGKENIKKKKRRNVCPYATTRLPLDGCSLNFVCEIFRKFVHKIEVSFKSDQNYDCFT